MSRLIVLLAIGLLSLSQGSQAHAQGCYGGFLNSGAFPGIAGYGANLFPYSLGHVPVPPYFALHPPVYYSAPVPRTYGYSPYAYPGTVMTPEIELPVPAMIENPHVTPQAEKKPTHHTAEGSTSEPTSEMVLNPYVKQSIAQR